MSQKPKFAAEWFEWFMREELPSIYAQETGMAPTPNHRQMSEAMEFLRRELNKRDKKLVDELQPKQKPLKWKLDDEEAA